MRETRRVTSSCNNQCGEAGTTDGLLVISLCRSGTTLECRDSSKRLKVPPPRHLSPGTDIYPILFTKSLSQRPNTSCPPARHSVCVINIVAHPRSLPCSAPRLPSRRSPSNGLGSGNFHPTTAAGPAAFPRERLGKSITGAQVWEKA